jgi:hypothetical protein
MEVLLGFSFGAQWRTSGALTISAFFDRVYVVIFLVYFYSIT